MKNSKTLLILALSLLTLSTMSYANSDEDSEHKGKRRGPPPFEKLDLNADGNISLEEFIQHKPPHGSPEEIFSKIDSNSDGYIDKAELRDHKPAHGGHK